MKRAPAALLVIAVTLASMPAWSAGQYRWAIKTGADALAPFVKGPVTTSVSALNGLSRPARISWERRTGPVELTAFTVRGRLLMYRREQDGDFHIVIQDENDQSTLVAEIPDPGDVTANSPWRQLIASARSNFERQFHPRYSRGNGDLRSIIISGVGFWDKGHGALGAAENNIELHPVLGYSLGR